MRILIVGTVRACYGKIHADGHQTVLFMSRDRAIPEDLTKIHDALLVLEKDAPLEMWADIASAMHQNQAFDAIVCYTDIYQNIAYAIANKIGVRCVMEKDVLDRTANKHLMRQALDKADVPHCRYQFARGKDAVIAAVEKIGLPCILKPVAGQASLGVVKLNNMAELEEALAWVGEAEIEHGVMVEEFLVGEEFSVEAISEAGKHYVIAITKKYKDINTFVEIGHLVPAPIDATKQAAIEAYVIKLLTALGFQDSPSHTELILTAAGPRVVETHTRLGGDRIIDLVTFATGVDLYELVVKQSVGESIAARIPEKIQCSQSSAIWYADPSTSNDQYLEAIGGVEDALSDPNVKIIELLKKEGTQGGPVKHSHNRTALAISVGSNAEEALRNSQEAIKKLQIRYQWRANLDGRIS